MRGQVKPSIIASFFSLKNKCDGLIVTSITFRFSAWPFLRGQERAEKGKMLTYLTNARNSNAFSLFMSRNALLLRALVTIFQKTRQ